MATKSKSKASNIPSGLEDQVKADIASAWDYVQSSYAEDWDKAWKLYNNERIDFGYKGIANSFDPMAYNVVETNIANVFGNKPRVVYLPTQVEQLREVKVLNQLFNYTWDKNNLSYHTIPFGRSLYVTGNATLWSTWDSETDWIKTTTKSVRDCILDPNAKNPWLLRYGGYRELVMTDDMKTVKMYNSETKEWTEKYQDIDKIPTWTNGENADLDKQLKDCYQGSFLDGNAKKGQCELTTLYYVAGPYKGKLIEIANRSIVVYFGDSPFQKKEETRTVRIAKLNDDGTPVKGPDGKPVFDKQPVTDPAIEPFIPISMQRNNTDESILYGKGEIEPIADLQEQLNDTINQKRDNFTHNINNQWTIDPKFKDQIPKIKNIPNTVYALPAGALVPLTKEDMTASADVEIARIKRAIHETAAMDEVVQGVQANGQLTATEINQQINQAGQRFGIKLQLLENEAYHTLADQWFKLFRIFVTEKQVVRIAGRKGIDWLELDPDLYWGPYEPKVTLEQNAKAQAQDEIKRIEAAGNIFLNNPYVDQKELTRVFAQRVLQYDDDEAETILVKDDMLPQPQGQAPQGMPGMPPNGMPNMQPGMQPPSPFPTMPNGQLAANPAGMPTPDAPDSNNGPKSIMERIIENIDYADLPEDIKRQVEEQLGFQPSNMASPVQQKVNIEGLKLHQQGNKHENDALLNLHSQIIDSGHKSAQLQHQMEQAAIGNQMQQEQMQQPTPVREP